MQMSWKSVVFFGGILVVVNLITVSTLVDETMLSRFLFLSLFLLLSLLVLGKELFQKKTFSITALDLVLLGYYAINLLSISWANNGVEALYEGQKVLFLLLVYFLAKYLLQKYPTQAFSALTYSALTVTGVTCLYVAAEMSNIAQSQGLNTNTVYMVTGLSGHKNLLSGFLMLLLPLIF